MKATIKNLTNGPRELRGVDGPIIVGAFDSVTNDFDEIWLRSARQVRYFEITDGSRSVKETDTSDEPVNEAPKTEHVEQPRPRGRPRKDA